MTKKGPGRPPKDRRLKHREVKLRTIKLPSMLIEVNYFPFASEVHLEELPGGKFFRFEPRKEVSTENLEIDAFALRRTFLDIATPGEALEYLNFAGRFQSPRGEDEFDVFNRLSWSDLQVWQKIIRSLLLGRPLRMKAVPGGIGWDVSPDWLPTLNKVSIGETLWLESPYLPEVKIFPDEPGLTRDAKMHAGISTHSILETILASIHLDNLLSIKHAECALEDCSNLFAQVSKHEREYCSQPCAHKASVRRKRAEIKNRKSHPGKGTETRH